MKKLLSLTLLVGLMITLFAACKTQAKEGPEYTSTYICPMHCEGSGSSEPGNCPVCKMAYVKNEDHQADHEGHDHGDHEGHDHEDHEGHDHEDHEGHDHEDHEGHDHEDHEGHNH